MKYGWELVTWVRNLTPPKKKNADALVKQKAESRGIMDEKTRTPSKKAERVGMRGTHLVKIRVDGGCQWCNQVQELAHSELLPSHVALHPL